MEQNSNLLVFQINSMINISKRAVQELRFLTKQNDGSDHDASGDRQQIKKQSEFVDRKFTLKQEKKNGRRPRFFL